MNDCLASWDNFQNELFFYCPTFLKLDKLWLMSISVRYSSFIYYLIYVFSTIIMDMTQ